MEQKDLNKILNEHKGWLNGNGGNRADLRDANLYGADLCDADLYGANLRGADLCGADLYGANLYGADGINLACPEIGAFIGFKKAYLKNNPVLVKLQILEDSKRSSATGRKCRCDKALVLEITDLNETIQCHEAFSVYDRDFIYKVGEIVSVNDFDDNRWEECTSGIHFFITKEEAKNY